MCSTDFGVLDLLFDKEDPTCKGLDGFRNTLFSSADVLDINDVDVKEEVLDSGTIDWKMSSEWDADELLRSVLDGQDLTCPSLDPLPSMVPHTLHPPDDMDSLEDLVGLPFHAVMDSGASDSGMSSDSSLDQQMSPGSGYSVSSPESQQGFSSPDPGLDTTSEISSISDLGFTSPHCGTIHPFPSSPEPLHAADDFLLPDSGFSSPICQGVCEPMSVVTPVTVTTHAPVSAPAPVVRTVVTKAATPARVNTTTLPASVNVSGATVVGAPLLKTVTVSGPGTTVGGQTIVVTQANKTGGPNTHYVRGPTILKSGHTSRSILLPVTVKDLNQVRTIKIISTSGSSVVHGRGVRTVVSTVRTPTTPSTTNHQSIRKSLLGTVRGQDTKSLLKGGASTLLTTGRPTTNTFTTSPTRVKLEPTDDDDDDDDDEDDDLQQPHAASQQLTLSDEEKRLLKKEGILLPSHYPLTKQEERELKRIRRKIRNKISAQDSRKRKKEYIDGLEDRVKACTDENQQLQKRIRSLEAQNESLLVQMKRFQSAVSGGGSGRLQTHASTAFMMLILSAALFIVPAVRQDGPSTDSDLSLPATKMPSAGHSRSLLEAGNVGVIPDMLDVLESVDDEVALEVEVPMVEALNDHDYTPVAKRQRTASKTAPYFVPPLDDFPPQHGKPDSGGGFPPDQDSVAKISARIMDTMVDQVTNNYSDPGGKHGTNAQAVVVKLGQGRKRLRDDLELE